CIAKPHRLQRVVIAVETESTNGRHVGIAILLVLEGEADTLQQGGRRWNVADRVTPSATQMLAPEHGAQGFRFCRDRNTHDFLDARRSEIAPRLSALDQRQEPLADLLGS